MPRTNRVQSILQRTNVLLVILLQLEPVEAPRRLCCSKRRFRSRLGLVVCWVLGPPRLLAVGTLVETRRVLAEGREVGLLLQRGGRHADSAFAE